MPKKKTSAHRTPWAKEDVRELKAHSKARTPLSEIAKKMNVPRGRCGERRGFSALVSAITADSPAVARAPRTHALGLPEGLRIYVYWH